MKKQLLTVLAVVGLFSLAQNANAEITIQKAKILPVALENNNQFTQEMAQSFGEDGERQYFRIATANKGTYDANRIGFLVTTDPTLQATCSDPATAGIGEKVCAVVKATPAPGFKEGVNIPGTQTFYYLQNTMLGARQLGNYVGYIYQEGIKPGAQVVGVYKANNY